nr:heterogeneous nuclear ribonucleoprotein A3 homolog 2-like [Ciona intestinalis]|eukprot:XP_026694298.1 heterogeneous nuclear ribonucleoprotein A3 homolog 2-like [Ciona intestinalis]
MPYGSGKEEEQSRKLFVGGINHDTTDDGMSAYFSKYGNVTDCVVIRDNGRSKGFGFVTFETEEEADACMDDRPHTLDSRTIDVKRAVSREESSKPGAHVQVKKIFIGGVKEGCDENALREYFNTFTGNARIESVEIPLDRETTRPKGFAFVTFDDFDVVDKLVAKRIHEIGGFRCEVKKALSKQEMDRAKQDLETRQSRFGGSRSRGGGGGRGGGRGRNRGDYGGGYGKGYGGYDDYDDYGGNFGPMRGQHGQRSSGPYGSGYGSYGSGGRGGGYGGRGNAGYEGGYANDGYGGGYGNDGYGNYSNGGYGGGSYGNSGYGAGGGNYGNGGGNQTSDSGYGNYGSGYGSYGNSEGKTGQY